MMRRGMRDINGVEMISEPTQEQKTDDASDDTLKHRRRRLTRRASGLTCNEASVDNILSEGESSQ